MKSRAKYEKNLLDFMNDNSKMINQQVACGSIVPEANKRTIFELNTTKKNKRVQELLQHIVNNEKSF